jgi:hypothetical protein
MNQMCITELEAPQLEPSAVKKCAVMHILSFCEKDFCCKGSATERFIPFGDYCPPNLVRIL